MTLTGLQQPMTYLLFLLFSSLKNAVRVAIGPIATPDFIVYSDLPKVAHTTHHTFVLCTAPGCHVYLFP